MTPRLTPAHHTTQVGDGRQNQAAACNLGLAEREELGTNILLAPHRSLACSGAQERIGGGRGTGIQNSSGYLAQGPPGFTSRRRMIRQAGFILRSAVGVRPPKCGARKKVSTHQSLRGVFTAKRSGSNRMLADVVGPYLLPDASALADFADVLPYWASHIRPKLTNNEPLFTRRDDFNRRFYWGPDFGVHG